MSEAFDFPFRKGIPIGTMNIKAVSYSRLLATSGAPGCC